MAPEPSVYKLSFWILRLLSSKNKDSPLKDDKNVRQMRISLLTERVRPMKKCSCEIRRVKSISRLKKAQPGVAT